MTSLERYCKLTKLLRDQELPLEVQVLCLSNVGYLGCLYETNFFWLNEDTSGSTAQLKACIRKLLKMGLLEKSGVYKVADNPALHQKSYQRYKITPEGKASVQHLCNKFLKEIS